MSCNKHTYYLKYRHIATIYEYISHYHSIYIKLYHMYACMYICFVAPFQGNLYKTLRNASIYRKVNNTNGAHSLFAKLLQLSQFFSETTCHKSCETGSNQPHTNSKFSFQCQRIFVLQKYATKSASNKD